MNDKNMEIKIVKNLPFKWCLYYLYSNPNLINNLPYLKNQDYWEWFGLYKNNNISFDILEKFMKINRYVDFNNLSSNQFNGEYQKLYFAQLVLYRQKKLNTNIINYILKFI